jgi:flagellar hook-basal body complex protein FliE
MALGPIEGSALSLMQPHPVFEGAAAKPARELPKPGTEAFSDMLTDAIARANTLSHTSQVAAEDLAAGRTDDIHGTMIEMQKASIETKLVGSVRNKVVDAFYELWRMSV